MEQGAWFCTSQEATLENLISKLNKMTVTFDLTFKTNNGAVTNGLGPEGIVS